VLINCTLHTDYLIYSYSRDEITTNQQVNKMFKVFLNFELFDALFWKDLMPTFQFLFLPVLLD
jgi:hypothetical protein